MDFIPVDFVANGIIIATAAQVNKNSLQIVHSSTKHLSSISIKDFALAIKDHFLLYPNE
jgi:hypothetical protein